MIAFWGRLNLIGIFLLFGNTGYGLVIETFGDSLTHGIFAKTSVTSSTPQLVSHLMGEMSKFGLTRDVGHIEPYGNKSDAWPNYLKDQFESESSQSVSVANASMIMNDTNDLLKQVRQINFSSTSDVMAFFFIGHNDLCPSLDESIGALTRRFKVQYRNALLEWDQMHDGAKAYILPVGNVDEAFSLLNHYTWFETTNGKKHQCNDQWGLYFPYCRRMGALAGVGRLKEVLRPRIEAMNIELRELVDEMNQRSGKNHYRYVGDMSDIPFEVSYFAVDCFHLSSQGQRAIARNLRRFLTN